MNGFNRTRVIMRAPHSVSMSATNYSVYMQEPDVRLKN